MPTYEFRCPDGTIIERIFKMSEVPDSIPAPDGKGVAVRIISGGADLIFKGSGFYITDYGKDGKKDQREKSSDSKSDSATKTETKAESKPESSKPEAKSDKTAPAEKKKETKPASSGKSE